MALESSPFFKGKAYKVLNKNLKTKFELTLCEMHFNSRDHSRIHRMLLFTQTIQAKHAVQCAAAESKSLSEFNQESLDCPIEMMKKLEVPAQKGLPFVLGKFKEFEALNRDISILLNP